MAVNGGCQLVAVGNPTSVGHPHCLDRQHDWSHRSLNIRHPIGQFVQPLVCLHQPMKADYWRVISDKESGFGLHTHFSCACGLHHLMQLERTPVQLPRRCLFESLENKPRVLSERRFRSFKCQLEVNKACQQSTERFRDLYAFDVDLLCACRRSSCRARQSCSATTDSTSPGRLSASCGSITVSETKRANWHWETINLADEYVPSIYHTVRYHSDSCLRGHHRIEQLYIPPTPNKTRDRCRSSDVNVPPETVVSEKALQVSKHTNASLPDDSSPPFRMRSLFHMWRARIRRASYKERAHKSLVRDTASPHSDEENIATPSEIPYTRRILTPQLPPPVPNPSPIKPITQQHGSVTTYKEVLPLGDSNSSQTPSTKLRQMKLTAISRVTKQSISGFCGFIYRGRTEQLFMRTSVVTLKACYAYVWTGVHTLATVKAAVYFRYLVGLVVTSCPFTLSIKVAGRIAYWKIVSPEHSIYLRNYLIARIHDHLITNAVDRKVPLKVPWSDNRQQVLCHYTRPGDSPQAFTHLYRCAYLCICGYTDVGRIQASPNRPSDNVDTERRLTPATKKKTPYIIMSTAKEANDDDPTSEALSTQSADSKPTKRPTECELKSESAKRLFGFGPDINWLCWTNSWIGLSYFITGLTLFLIHAITYSWSASTLQLHCGEGRCWSFVPEKNPYSHSYNLMKYTKYLYDDPHIGLGFGLFLLIFGVISGFRFSRLLVNLGFICNVTLTTTCTLLLPLTILELRLAYESHAQAKLKAPCHWNRIRAINDLVMLVTMLLLSAFQLVINYPYLQYRSINRLGPLLYYIKTSQRLSNMRLKNNTTFNEFTV
ncbi:hypothetical protein CLF_108528 [Clonorchis sinensis]|uniref:Uncharacterized protein n=1 Tax=Clonorchis sinensis TaxID=79923 RepID=H2KS95_CLOSI|nr:hypothetical protein CLF_108528 [Clonorchis sinensis]